MPGSKFFVHYLYKDKKRGSQHMESGEGNLARLIDGLNMQKVESAILAGAISADKYLRVHQPVTLDVQSRRAFFRLGHRKTIVGWDIKLTSKFRAQLLYIFWYTLDMHIQSVPSIKV